MSTCDVSETDVGKEKYLTNTLIREKKQNDYAIIVSNLQKNYNDFVAVDGIDFAVKRGECFGLLGINGAGKTTTFKMLTRDTTITNGDIFINGMSCYENTTNVSFGRGFRRERNSDGSFNFSIKPCLDIVPKWMR